VARVYRRDSHRIFFSSSTPRSSSSRSPLLLLAWRTWRIGWGDWWGFPIGGVWLVDGRFVRAFALNPPSERERGQSPGVPRALEGLNAELARMRARAA
jgi:hypothetical protein